MKIVSMLLILLAVLLILFQRVDVRITKTESLTVKISFIFLAITLVEENVKRLGFKEIKKTFFLVKGLAKSAKHLISKTGIERANGYIIDAVDGKKTVYIDICIHFSLFRMIISALILLYYIVKNKAKRVMNNV